jgi:hypothetical protein
VVLEKGRQKLDFPYIERWIAELGLVSQWAEARRRAGLE